MRKDFLLATQELVSRFKAERGWAKSEEHIQTLFTTKILESLGWSSADIRINQGQAVKTGKKPDILLHQGDSTLLVIESKDASKRGMLDGHYQSKTFVEQLHGYCRAEGIFWGVLTNFVEWRVYSVYQNRLYKERKYAFHDLLWSDADPENYIDLFSDEGLLFFEQISRSTLTPRKGRWDDDPIYYPQQKEIKAKFFSDLKKWRLNLRAYLASKYKKKYDLGTIDLITQRILDQLIFTDYCADNNIISQDRLHAIMQSKGGLQAELSRVFSDMDEKFNSELFSASERDKVELDDDIIRPIIAELADIDFRKLSVHVIGEVYENYLGELLKAGKTGVAVDENQTAQRKKSQGIYYTPENIVDYIVENTVGEVLRKCKTTAEIENIRVLDPACGSGSFLIRVFDEFLKHYQRIEKSPLFHFEMRRRILQNNIYGVDLDERAVEIAKLNLLVKALEGSSGTSISGRKLLPNLKLNIRCGNSLISGEVMKQEQAALWQTTHAKELTNLKDLRKQFHAGRDDAKKKLIFQELQVLEEVINSKLNDGLEAYFSNIDESKPLNYSVAFPEVFDDGGFDCIVGNPPYIDSELMTTEQPESRSFISEHYDTAKGNWDIYIAFLERAHKLANGTGHWAYITPDKWISKPFGEALRTTTIKKMRQLLKVGREVFSDANVDSIVTIFGSKETKRLKVYDYSGSGGPELINDVDKKTIKPPFEYDYLFSKSLPILMKIEEVAANQQFSFLCENACATSDAYKLKPLIIDLREAKFDHEKHFKVINTGTVGKFASRWGYKEMTYLQGKYLYPVVNKKKFQDRFRNTYGKKADKPKLIIKGLTLLDGSLDLKGQIVPGKSTLVVFADDVDSIKYLSAIINSKIAYFYLSQKHPSASYNQGVAFTKDMINTLPIPIPSKGNYAELISRVDRITSIYEELYIARDEKAISRIQIRVKAAERELNKLVYDLYGLSDDEIAVVSRDKSSI